jgi:hypothetical protein
MDLLTFLQGKFLKRIAAVTIKTSPTSFDQPEHILIGVSSKWAERC